MTESTLGSSYVDRGLLSIAMNGGLAWSKSYPFTGTDGICYFNLTTPSVQTYGLGFKVVEGEGDDIPQMLFDKGPILTSNFKVMQDFIDYSTGIYMSDACNQGTSGLFNHTLLIIGFGVDQTDLGPVKYWLVQNSWGTGWGLSGYAKI